MAFKLKSEKANGLFEKPWYQQERLSIKTISEKLATDGVRPIQIQVDIIEACKNGELKYYGDINGCEWGGNPIAYVMNNLYPDVKGEQIDYGDPMRTAIYNKWRARPSDCLVGRNEFRRYLESTGNWNNDSLSDLREWWGNKINSNNNQMSNERDSQLHEVIWTVYIYLKENPPKKFTANDVWKEIKKNYAEHDVGEIIDEVTEDTIFWTSTYGNSQSLKKSSLPSLLTRLKKLPPF